MATSIKHAIGEHDYVALTTPINKAESAGTWPAGTRGTVISDYKDHMMLDICDELGKTLDMPIVPAEKLTLIG